VPSSDPFTLPCEVLLILNYRDTEEVWRRFLCVSVVSIFYLSGCCFGRISLTGFTLMPLIEISDLNDPRLHVYRNIKKTNLTRWSTQSIAEGKKLTIRLLKSDFDVASVLTSDKHVDLLTPHLRDDVPAFVVPHQLAQMLVGQTFHAGMLGCGIRKIPPTLEDLMKIERRHLIAVCCGVENLENMGGIIRAATGFGATALLLGPGCCDPFSRRALRVSMGSALNIPILEAGEELSPMLTMLRNQHRFNLIAAILYDNAMRLRDCPTEGNIAVLLGNEDAGLDVEWLELCIHRITIPMHSGTDSLNVAVASAVFLHHFAENVNTTAHKTGFRQ
jgi:tRNA G18 (ribose-2'-O)-methylase SpoU